MVTNSGRVVLMRLFVILRKTRLSPLHLRVRCAGCSRLGLFLTISANAGSVGFSQEKPSALYQPDWSVLERHPDEASRFREHFEALQQGESSAAFENAIQALSTVLTREKSWVDGHWRVSLLYIDSAGQFTSRKQDFPEASALLKQAAEHASECLRVAENNPLCQFAQAATFGSQATIDGVIASLKNARAMHKLLVAVRSSGVDYDLGSKGTLQENVLHALGMFKRLVPDSFMVNMMFGIRGNLKESVALHTEALKVFGPSPCALVMTAVSRMCFARDQGDANLLAEAKGQLARAQGMSSREFDENICIRDAGRILEDNSLSCDYHRAALAD